MNHAPRHLRFVWRDGVFVPDGPRMAAYCDEQFGEGEAVTFERHEEVSAASRGHYFACIKEVWDNLPETEHDRFPTPEYLRKWALIRNKYCTVNETAFDTAKDAITAAAFMGNSEGVIIVVRDNIVRRYVAKSQSAKAMGKEEFQRSKTDVLDTLAELLAIKRKDLEKNAGRAA